MSRTIRDGLPRSRRGTSRARCDMTWMISMVLGCGPASEDATGDVDCDDEVCDGIDNDCDGEVDEDATDAVTGYADADADGYGAGTPHVSCAPLPGTVERAGDCDDT